MKRSSNFLKDLAWNKNQVQDFYVNIEVAETQAT